VKRKDDFRALATGAGRSGDFFIFRSSGRRGKGKYQKGFK